MTQSDQIRKLLSLGWSTEAITKKVGCSAGLVYVVKSADNRSGKKKPHAIPSSSRSHKAKPKPSQPTDVFAAIRSLDAERTAMRRAIDGIRALLAKVAQ